MKMPESLQPVGLFDHAKKRDGKPIRPLVGIRNSRLDEIRGGMAALGHKGTKADASRTFQPSKGFDLGQALELEKQKEEEETKKQPAKQVETIQIFKTHRHFSDFKADDLHRELSDLE